LPGFNHLCFFQSFFMPHQLYDIGQVAEYLHIKEDEVRRLVKRGELPCLRKGDRVMFQRREIDAWASQRILAFDKETLASFHDASAEVLNEGSNQKTLVSDFFRREWIEPELHSKTRAAVVRDMVQLAERTERVYDPADLLTTLREREEIRSTALPGGLALLHPRHHDPYMFSESFMVLGRTVHPVPFGGPDGRTTDLFFLICSQYDRLHLHLLTRICRMVKQTSILEDLRSAPDAGSMLEVITEAEARVV